MTKADINVLIAIMIGYIKMSEIIHIRNLTPQDSYLNN